MVDMSSPGMLLQIGFLSTCTHWVLRNHEPKNITHAVLAVLPGALGSLIIARSSTWQLTFLSVLSYIAMLFASIVLYRVSPFHPLAEFPGPFSNKITQLVPMWIVYTGHQHYKLREWHAKYGPFVRIGPNDLSIVDATAVPAVLGGSGLPKGHYYRSRQIPNGPLNIIGMHGEAHAARRKLWNRGFTPVSLQLYEEHIAKHASTLANRLKESEGQDTDLVMWINCFTFDVMGDVIFGRSFNMINEGDKEGIWRTLEKFTIQGAIASHVPWARSIFLAFPVFSKYFTKMRNFGMRNATQRLNSGTNVKDLWYYLADEAGLEKVKPTIGDVGADGTFAVVAGSDTTASVLSSLFWFLLQNPTLYAKVKEEIDSVYGDSMDSLSSARHGQLVYLNACVNETLRLHPPLPTNGPRQVPNGSRGKLIAGRYIPAGVQIYVPPYCLHRDPRYFSPSPDSFIPDRWLSSNSDQAESQSAFIPFSYGPANCVGRQMAKQEILMLVCFLLQNFDFEFAPSFRGREADMWEDKRYDYMVTSRAPLMIRVRSRN